MPCGLSQSTGHWRRPAWAASWIWVLLGMAQFPPPQLFYTTKYFIQMMGQSPSYCEGLGAWFTWDWNRPWRRSSPQTIPLKKTADCWAAVAQVPPWKISISGLPAVPGTWRGRQLPGPKLHFTHLRGKWRAGGGRGGYRQRATFCSPDWPPCYLA